MLTGYSANKNQRRKKRVIIGVSAVSILVLATILALDISGKTSIFFNSGANTQARDDSAKTTSGSPSAQSDFTTGDTSKQPGNTLNENKGQAGVQDTNGQASTNTSSPRTSSTREITVYLPIDNATVSTGQELSGTSSLSSISYRIVDDLSGVIGGGTLKVVSGKFSGKLSFSSGATEGRIDIYGVRSDLSEFSNIEIPVRF